MTGTESSPIFEFDGGDPEMKQAIEQARSTFRFFWREIIRDRSRIVPVNGMESVKVPFSEERGPTHSDDNPGTEEMWLSDPDFDGKYISGVLINSPAWIKSVKEGDNVNIQLDQISDWICVRGDDEVYGAYTVNVIRSRMSKKERLEHDAAWGLKFGDPLKPRTLPENDPPSLTTNLLTLLRNTFDEDPSHLSEKGHNGWTILHKEASGGNVAVVRFLIEAGADRNAITNNGLTPFDIAQTLGWTEIAKLLRSG